jgi:hypothetical protein
MRFKEDNNGNEEERLGWVRRPDGVLVANNPEGIESFSPGLRVRELPWVWAAMIFNPNGVASFRFLDRDEMHGDATPSGLWRTF